MSSFFIYPGHGLVKYVGSKSALINKQRTRFFEYASTNATQSFLIAADIADQYRLRRPSTKSEVLDALAELATVIKNPIYNGSWYKRSLAYKSLLNTNELHNQLLVYKDLRYHTDNTRTGSTARRLFQQVKNHLVTEFAYVLGCPNWEIEEQLA
jgi:RNA polymerase-interacting CarD/CdnL/TRCF family regulator